MWPLPSSAAARSKTIAPKPLSSASPRYFIQQESEIATAYQAWGTPSAVLVNADGRIGSSVAQGADAIRTLWARVNPQGAFHGPAALPRLRRMALFRLPLSRPRSARSELDRQRGSGGQAARSIGQTDRPCTRTGGGRRWSCFGIRAAAFASSCCRNCAAGRARGRRQPRRSWWYLPEACTRRIRRRDSRRPGSPGRRIQNGNGLWRERDAVRGAGQL